MPPAITSSVIYDRAGTGWSDPTVLPHPAAVAADEAYELLRVLDAPAPCVLVGHSLGGAHARVFAHRHPGEVAGLVLVEPLHEDWDAYQPVELQLAQSRITADELPELTPDILDGFRDHLGRMLAPFPDTVRDALLARHLQGDQVRNSIRDGANVLDVVAELRTGTDPDAPTIVLGGTGIDPGQAQFLPTKLLERQILGHQQLYTDYTTAVPHREYRALSDTSHSGVPSNALTPSPPPRESGHTGELGSTIPG